MELRLSVSDQIAWVKALVEKSEINGMGLLGKETPCVELAGEIARYFSRARECAFIRSAGGTRFLGYPKDHPGELRINTQEKADQLVAELITPSEFIGNYTFPKSLSRSLR